MLGQHFLGVYSIFVRAFCIFAMVQEQLNSHFREFLTYMSPEETV